jgi:hypothetical protein
MILDRSVTYEIRLALLHLRAWPVVVDSRPVVLLLLLGLLLSGFRALTDKVPGLSTIVAQPGRKLFRFGDRLLGFLNKAEPLSLLFLCLLRDSRRCCNSGALSGLARVTTSLAFTWTSLCTGNLPLTYIYLR